MGGEEKKCYNCTFYNNSSGYCNLHKRKMNQHSTCKDHKKKGS